MQDKKNTSETEIKAMEQEQVEVEILKDDVSLYSKAYGRGAKIKVNKSLIPWLIKNNIIKG